MTSTSALFSESAVCAIFHSVPLQPPLPSGMLEELVDAALAAETGEARRAATDRVADWVHEHTHDGLRDLLLHASDRFRDPGADRPLLKRLARLLMAA